MMNARSGKRFPAAAFAVALLIAPAALRAQSRAVLSGATPTRIPFDFDGACGGTSATIHSTGDLAREYDDGAKWATLQHDLQAILASCVEEAPDGVRRLPAAEGNTFLVAFISGSTPYYVVVPQSEPYRLALAGIRSVIPVVLVDAAAAREAPVNMHFLSSRVDDPRGEQIPAFMKEIIIKAVRSETAPAAGPAAAMRAWAANEVELPFRRASVAEAGTVTVNCAAGDASPPLAPCPRGKTAIDVPLATTYANAPKMHLEFTAAAVAVGPYRGHPQLKVDAGKYASDPATHAATLAAIAIHLWPFDVSSAEMTKAERWALIAGAVLTPAAGAAAGLSIGIVRGFALTAGELIVWVPSGAGGALPGAPAPAGTSQLPHKYSYAPFVGGSYRFAR